MKVAVTTHGVPREPGAPSQDIFAVRQRDSSLIAVLADGVSGSREGRAAAERTVGTISNNYLARPVAWSPARALDEFVTQLNRQLYAESLQRYGSPEWLCTVATVAFEGNALCGLNVGDSPVFLWREGRLQRLSETHVFASDEMRHVLTRAVGLDREVATHEFVGIVQPGDLVVLCSDGVTHHLDETALGDLLRRRASARAVVQAARERAQPDTMDDLSAIVIEVLAAPQSPAVEKPLEILGSVRAGEVVDGYELDRELADGGRVWLAEDQAAQKFVFKLPPSEARYDEAIAAAFIREAWHASRCGGGDMFPRAFVPDLPTWHGYALEYLDGPTLREVLKQRRLTVEEAAALGKFLLRAAGSLLRHDLAHGDIKPDNIVMLDGGPAGPPEFRLLDFGSATELFAARGRAGTPSYLAPERFAEAPLSERTEIFAIGVTLYEALCQTYPYGEIERFQRPRFEAFPRLPSKLNPSIPPWFEAVLLRALSTDPERRHQVYSEMRFELEHPEQVAPFHRKGAPLLERNPVAFFRLAFLLSAALNLFLLVQCAHSR